MDTCSACVEFSAKAKLLQRDKTNVTDDDRLKQTDEEIKRLQTEFNQVH